MTEDRPICDYCGMEIEEEDQQCYARDPGLTCAESGALIPEGEKRA
jgi:hypothetical protein